MFQSLSKLISIIPRDIVTRSAISTKPAVFFKHRSVSTSHRGDNLPNGELLQSLRTYRPRTFLSYNWKNKPEADELDNYFNNNLQLLVTRDERNLEYKGSIKAFMSAVREHDHAIMLISKDWLQSRNCLYEMMQFIKDPSYREKILPVILPDAEIFKQNSELVYTTYWKIELDRVKQQIRNFGLEQEETVSASNEMKVMKEICIYLESFIADIKDMNCIMFDAASKKKFKPLLENMLRYHQRNNAKHIESLPGSNTLQITGRDKQNYEIPIELRVPKKTENFVKRLKLIKKIKFQLEGNSQTAMTDTAIFSGLGGIGKTQLAIEYVNLYSKNYHYVFWCKADSEPVLNNSLLHLAKFLNIKVTRYTHNLRDEIKAELIKTKKSLLIFDNVSHIDQVKDFLLKGHHVLITTRNTKDITNPINVSVFTDEESLEFFPKSTGIMLSSGNKDCAVKIISSLSKHPLALAQAGNYIKVCGISYEVFHGLLLSNREKLLSHKVLDPNYEHKMPVGKVLALTLDKIRKENPLAVELLKYMSFLHPDSIRFPILKNIIDNVSGKGNESVSMFQLVDALKVLKEYHVIENGNDIYTMHRLTQSVVKDNMLKYEEKKQVTDRLILFFKALFNYKRHELSSWIGLKDLVNHVVCLLDQEIRKDVDSATLFIDAGMYYSYLGDFVNAISLFKEAINYSKDGFSREERGVLAKAKAELSILYGHIGELDQGFFLMREAFSIFQEIVYVKEDLAYYYTLYGVGLQFAGKFESANNYYHNAMKIYNELSIFDGPYYARTLSCMAHLMAEECNFSKAEKTIRESLDMLSRSPENPFACRTYTIAGTIYTNMGKFDLAKRYFELAIQENKNIYKRDKYHFPYVAHTYLEYGIYYQLNGQYDLAKESFNAAMDIYENTYKSKKNRNYIKALIYKGSNLLLSGGSLFEAKNCIYQARDIVKELGLEKSIDMARIYALFALMKFLEDDFLSAANYLDRAQSIFKELSVDTETFDLASCYLLRARVRNEDSLENINKAIEIYKGKMNASHYLYKVALEMKLKCELSSSRLYPKVN